MSENDSTSPARWRILPPLMVLCFVSHLNRLAMPVAGTEKLIPEHKFTPDQMGQVYTAYLAVYTVGMLFGGWCIDRFGARVMLLVMGGGSALFGALTGILGFNFAALGAAHFLVGLMIARGAMGMFTTPLHPACARAVGDWFPASRQSSANGLVTFAAVLGMASAAPLFGAMMDRLGWPAAFLAAAGALVAVTIIWRLVGRDPPARIVRRNPTKEEVDARPPLLSSSLVFLTLSYAAVGYFQYLFFYWSEYYFKDVLRLSTTQSRLNSTVLILALGLGMPVGGWLAGRAQRRFAGRVGGAAIIPGGAMMLSAVFLFLGVFASREAFWIVCCFALAMFALGASESSFWQTAVRLGGSRGGLAAAIINTGGNGVGLLAPMLTPVISASFGWRWGICIGGVVGLLGALCWLGVDPDPPANADHT